MEHLAETMTDFLLRRKYITEEQTEWCHYMLIKNIMSIASLVLLLPLGALIVGWGGTLFYTFVFRFLRARTGGYHAYARPGCFRVYRGIFLPVNRTVRPCQSPGTAPERERTESTSAAHLHSAADCGRPYGSSFIFPPRLGCLYSVRCFCGCVITCNLVARLWCTIALYYQTLGEKT